MGNKKLWKVFAWIFIVCGVFTYLIGWGALFSRSIIWGVPTEFWFYDAVAAGVFGIFFLMYSLQDGKKQMRKGNSSRR